MAEDGDKLGKDLTHLFETWNKHAVKSEIFDAYRSKELRTQEVPSIKSALKAKYTDKVMEKADLS